MPAGKITLVNNSADVTGTDTAFDTALSAGDMIVATTGGITYTLPVKSVESDSQLTLVRAYDGPSETELAWSAVPRDTLSAITAQIASDVAYTMRSRVNELNNWYQLLKVDGDVTIRLADGATFSGPSWLKIAGLAESANFDGFEALAERVTADAEQVAADKAGASHSAVLAEDAVASANASAAQAAESAHSAGTSAADAATAKGEAESALAQTQDIATAFQRYGFVGEHSELNLDTRASRTWAVNVLPGSVYADEQGNFLGQALIINVNGEKNVRNLAVQASDGFLYGQIVVDNRQDGRSAVFGFQDEGSIKGNQGAVLWSGSDRKLKDNITDADKPDKALERINAIRRRFFAWKADGREDIGVIAQELAEIDLRYVYECGMMGESILGVSQAALISDLIGAVQALTEQNKSLVKRLNGVVAKQGRQV